MKKEKKKWRPRLLLALAGLVLLLLVIALGLSVWMKASTESSILNPEAELPEVDCILVLGCSVYQDGTPSPMLTDRLETAVDLYQQGAAPVLLVSGDNGRVDYDEVGGMKTWAVNHGVPPQAVFRDHAGFSTYDSLARARDVFGAKRVLIVTQRYHLYRALYLARALGIEAWGAVADLQTYSGQWTRDLREILARDKDFLWAIVQPAPKYLGEPIPLSGDGNTT